MGGRIGKRPLSAVRVKNAPAGMHQDGGSRGLYLRVSETGARSWIFRYSRDGRRRDMGIGPVDLVPLAEAREKVLELRRRLLQGVDPLAERDAGRRAQTVAEARARWTFKAAAEAVHETLAPGWRNPKHAAQWIATLEAYAFPAVGDMHVGAIGVADVVEVLRPIWTTKAETARRVRQRIDATMRWAVAHGHAAVNPVAAAVELLPRQRDQVEHHAAVAVADMPAFWQALAEREPAAAVLALRFAILTAARSGEVRGASWSEVDKKARTWTIPAERMKAGREHVVPLSDAALAVLEQAGELFDTDPNKPIFPSPLKGRTLSDMALGAVLRRMQVEATAHGFRSTFRDWCAESGVAREVAERALAHAVKDSTEAAYSRTQLIEQRRPVMVAWAAFLTGSEAVR